MNGPNLKHKKLVLIGSGKSVHVRNFYQLIKDLFKEVLVVTNEEIDYALFKLVSFSIKNPLAINGNVKAIRNVLQDYQPDLIHVHQANSVGYLTAKANIGLPLVLTTWGSDVLTLPSKGLLYKKMVQKALQGADVVTADADFMLEKIDELGYHGKTLNANFGIDITQVHPEFEQKKNWIYSNRLHNPLYNIDQIIRGSKAFLEQNSNWKLIIAATGSETEKLKILANSVLPKNSFEFIGFVSKDDNFNFYKSSKIWVSIPSSDGTAVSLLEAMAFGCVPVLSDLPANKEWVSHNQNGIISAEFSSRDLFDAEKKISQDLANTNLSIIQERASKQASLANFKNIYQSLL